MSLYLVFRLAGALAAWGDVAVGERRPSFSHPSKSAVLGLVAGALGLRRDEEQSLSALFDGYGFALRVDDPGELLIDYHTAQTAPASLLKGRPPGTRREELNFERHELKTILSRREYRSGSASVACLWATEDPARWSLEALAEALRRPVFVPYLGRKSCPPAVPFEPKVVEAGTPVQALEGAKFEVDVFLGLSSRVVPTFRWEGGSGDGAMETVTRRDQPGNRKRWQFADRVEHVRHGKEK